MDITKKKISNWAKTYSKTSLVIKPKNQIELTEAISFINKKKMNFSVMSSNKNYTDEVFCSNGYIIDITNINKIFEINHNQKTIVVETACTLKKLLKNIIPNNYTIGAIPGSEDISIGGAITNCVHGKDAKNFGCFFENINEITILKSNGQEVILKKKEIPKILTFGVFYIIKKIKLNLIEIKSKNVISKKIIFNDLDEMIQIMTKNNDNFMYGWVDLNLKKIRGYIEIGNIEKNISFHQKNLSSTLDLILKYLVNFLSNFIKFSLNKYTLKIINFLIFYAAKLKNKKIINLYDFYFPLKRLPIEKFFMGGVIEIQILIPEKNLKYELINIMGLCNKYNISSYLTGLKYQKDQDISFGFYKKGLSISIVFPKYKTKSSEFSNFKEKLSKLINEKKIYLNLTKDLIFDKHIIDQNDKVNFIKYKKFYDVEGIIKSDFIERYELNYEI